MVAWLEVNFDPTGFNHITPVADLDTRRLDTRANDGVVAERRDEKRLMRHM